MGKKIKTPNARRKMGEARFFLEQLQNEAAGGRSKRSGAFGYYLSAFLTAAASVIDVAFKEKPIKKPEFEKWRDYLDAQEQSLLSCMKEQRRSEVHFKGAKLVPKESHIARTFYPHVQPLPLSVMLQGSVEKGPKDDVTGLPLSIRVWIPNIEYHFVKGPAHTEPVLAECIRILAVLEKFMSWVEKDR